MSEEITLDPWIEGYLEFCREVQKRSPGTIRDKRCTLKRVCRRMEAIRPGVALWKLSLEDYLQWVETEREAGMAPKSIQKDISHIRGLLNYAWKCNRTDRNVLDGFSLQDDRPVTRSRVLSLEEARALIEACPRRTAADRWDRTIILLLYGCGLRTGELTALDVPDVDRERQEIFIRKAKGDTQRRIPVPEGVWTELLAYLADRGGKRGALFRTTAMRKRISSKTVTGVVDRAAAAAGIEGRVYPKTLRHSFASHLVDAGVSLPVIASLMGHRSIRETNTYLHTLPGDIQRAVEQLNTSEESEDLT